MHESDQVSDQQQPMTNLDDGHIDVCDQPGRRFPRCQVAGVASERGVVVTKALIQGSRRRRLTVRFF